METTNTSSSYIPRLQPNGEVTVIPYNATHLINEVMLDPMKATFCTEEVIDFKPSNAQFLEILGPAGYAMVALATLGFLSLVILFIDTIVRLHKVIERDRKFKVTIVLSVYPVLGLCTFLGILFPKADIILDVSSQLWFALCMLQFFKLTLSYFGGERQFVESLEGKVLPWRGLPCCFWPCCWPLCPKQPVNKTQIRFIRILVYQHPFVQSIMTIIGIAIWKEGSYTFGDFSPYKGHVYVFTVTSTSFLLALWAFIVTFKASLPELRRFHYGRKILVFQLCLIFLRFQALIFAAILLPSGAIPCLPPLSPSVYANTILCCLLLGQLVVLSVMARWVYLLPYDEPRDVLMDDKSAVAENGTTDHTQQYPDALPENYC